MGRTLRLGIGVLVTLALVGFAIMVLVLEVSFGLEAVSTTATVENYAARSNIFGRGKANVVHDVDGQPVKATLRTWFFFRPAEGERVVVLFVPAEPGRVELDSVVQRYGPVALPLGLAIAVAYWAGLLCPRRGAQGCNQPGAAGTGSSAAEQSAPADRPRD